MAVFVVAGEPWTPGAAVVCRNFIEAEDANEDHAHNWSGEKKCLPAGLKCDTVHMRLPAIKTADVR